MRGSLNRHGNGNGSYVFWVLGGMGDGNTPDTGSPSFESPPVERIPLFIGIKVPVRYCEK